MRAWSSGILERRPGRFAPVWLLRAWERHEADEADEADRLVWGIGMAAVFITRWDRHHLSGDEEYGNC